MAQCPTLSIRSNRWCGLMRRSAWLSARSKKKRGESERLRRRNRETLRRRDDVWKKLRRSARPWCRPSRYKKKVNMTKMFWHCVLYIFVVFWQLKAYTFIKQHYRFMFYFTGTEATEGAQLYHPKEGSISKKFCIFFHIIWQKILLNVSLVTIHSAFSGCG